MDLDFVITSPFRSLFNLNTDALAADPGRAARLFAAIARELGRSHGLDCATAWRVPGDAYAQFVTLSDDFVPASALPALIVGLDSGALGEHAPEAAALVAAAADAAPSRPTVTLSRAEIHFFDNTLSILRLVINVSGLAREDAPGFLAAFDPAVFGASVAAAKFAHKICAEVIAAALRLEGEGALAPRKGGARAVRRPGGFLAFADVNFAHRGELDIAETLAWPEDVGSVLWAARLMCVPKAHEDLAEELAQAWRATAQSRVAIDGEPGRWMACNVGSSLALGTADAHIASGQQAAFEKVQYFYCQFDLMRRMFRERYGDLVDGLRERRFGEVQSMITRLSAQAAYMVSEYEETALGLQSGRKQMFARFNEVYETERLIGSMRMKQSSVVELAQDLAERFAKKSRKRIETAAFAIGAVALTDFLLNLAWFSRELVSPERVWPGPEAGPVSWLSHLSGDVVVFVLIALLAGVTVAYARSRR